MRKSYPSDISREQFEKILPPIEAFRKKTRPRVVDLFCGVLYVLKSGCQWRMWPGDFPKWRTVHEYFRIWCQPLPAGGQSLLEQLLAELVGEVRQEEGRNEHTSMIIIDSPSVKNTDTAGETGFAGGKQVKGIKQHVGVDILGLPQVIHVTTANVTDREAALEMFQLHSDSLPAVKTVLADGG